MRNGICLFGLLVILTGCDFRAFVPPNSPMTRNPSRQGRQVFATPGVEDQLSEIEGRLQTQPDDLGLLKTKAILLQQAAYTKIQNGDRTGGYADYETSGGIWRKIKTTTPQLSNEDADACSTAIYNLGCALSLKKEIEPALTALRESVESGFSNLDLFQTNTDLDPLRDQTGFKTLIDDIPKLRLTFAKRLVAPDALFPFEFSLNSIQDKTVASKDYAGKVLIVDVWGTWCGPCRQEIPSFVALHKKFKDKGLEIVGINYEHEQDPTTMKQIIQNFVVQNEMPYECVIGDERTQAQIPGFGGYPTTLFLDRQGRVRAKFEGVQSYETLQSVAEVLLSEADPTIQ